MRLASIDVKGKRKYNVQNIFKKAYYSIKGKAMYYTLIDCRIHEKTCKLIEMCMLEDLAEM
jgi:hypothetical protein